MKRVVLLFAGLILSSCGERSPLQFDVKEELPLSGELNFSSVRAAILRPKCVSCHRQYDTYAGVKPDLEKIIAAVESDRMPKNALALSPNQKDFLRKWVSLGAPAGDLPEPTDDETLKPNWASLEGKLFGPKCIQCHNPNGEAKFLDLSARSEIWKERQKLFNFDDPGASYFIEVISDVDEPMPPAYSGLPRLSSEEINVLKKWIGDGLP